MKNSEFDAIITSALKDACLIRYDDALRKTDDIHYSAQYQNNIGRLLRGQQPSGTSSSRSGQHFILRRAVCAVLILSAVLGSIFVFNPTARTVISNAFSHILKYIPGTESYLSVTADDANYTLSGSVTADYGDSCIKINSAYTYDGNLIISLEGSADKQIDLNSTPDISVTDANGHAGKQTDFNYIDDMEDNHWSCLISFGFKNASDYYDLFVNGKKIPLVLTKADSIQPENSNFYDDLNLGIQLAAATEYKDGLLKAAVISKACNADSDLTLPLQEMYLLTQDGEKISPLKESDLAQKGITDEQSSSALYFDTPLQEGIRLVIPYLTISEYPAPVSFRTQKEHGYQGTLSLGGRQLKIEDIGWSDYYESIQMRKLEGGRTDQGNMAQKISFHIHLYEKSEKNLELISLDIQASEKNEYYDSETKLIWDDPYRWNETFTADGIKADVSQTEIRLSSPVYKTTNAISILLRP